MSDSKDMNTPSTEERWLRKDLADMKTKLEKCERDNYILMAIIAIGIALVVFSPGFKVQSDDFYKSQLEKAIESTKQEEIARIFDDSGYGHDIMLCVAFDSYSKGTASASLTRWLEEDYGVSGLEDWCYKEPVPELPFQDP
jgi:hypothetical protein